MERSEYPSVTKIIRGMGLYKAMPTGGVATGNMQRGMERGTLAHSVCQLWDQEDLDESSVDPRLDPYLEGFKLWKRDYETVPIWWEIPMFDDTLQAKGRPDTGQWVRGYRTLVDLKTGDGGADPAHPIQGAAYRRMVMLPENLSVSRMVQTADIYFGNLYLLSNGKYQYFECSQEDILGAEQKWLAAVLLYHFRLQHGRL
jgi:hypothetical protein